MKSKRKLTYPEQKKDVPNDGLRAIKFNECMTQDWHKK